MTMFLKYTKNAPYWTALLIFAMFLTTFMLVAVMVILASLLYPLALSIAGRILPDDILAMEEVTSFFTYAAVMFTLIPGFRTIRSYVFLRLDTMFMGKIQQIVRPPSRAGRSVSTL